ncbi:MAG: ribosome-associated translation inhibitor RaiA [Candidatus Portnoybacteria bacterium]|nr:ribosome-associated translation inhibitor RaiA [Candidatus Portnoybacteria bacterium]
MFKIIIKTKNIDADENLKRYIHEKIGSLEKLFPEEEEIITEVEVGKPSKHHKKGPHFYAEANISIPGPKKPLRAESYQEEITAAIDEIKDILFTKINRFKDKKETKRRKRRRRAKRIMHLWPFGKK